MSRIRRNGLLVVRGTAPAARKAYVKQRRTAVQMSDCLAALADRYLLELVRTGECRAAQAALGCWESSAMLATRPNHAAAA